MAISRIGASEAAPPVLAATGAPERGTRTSRFIEVLKEGQTPDPPASPARPPPAEPRGPDRTSGGEAIRGMLDAAVKAERRIDDILAAAARGKTFTAGELLAVQAAVFRYSQTVEVVSRVADRLVGAVKQTLGTQV